jgi:hypothetical protein
VALVIKTKNAAGRKKESPSQSKVFWLQEL